MCTYCDKTSYSAADSPTVKWICPYCGQDISEIKGQTSPPEKKEKL